MGNQKKRRSEQPPSAKPLDAVEREYTENLKRVTETARSLARVPLQGLIDVTTEVEDLWRSQLIDCQGAVEYLVGLENLADQKAMLEACKRVVDVAIEIEERSIQRRQGNDPMAIFRRDHDGKCPTILEDCEGCGQTATHYDQDVRAWCCSCISDRGARGLSQWK